jgi:NADPH:quinone reductase-like Zn-dependent oxidoreductase
MDFLIAREDLHSCRFEDAPRPQPGEGEALLAVRSFGLSSNNITYATFGEAMSYWSFFPAPEGWGRMPVWGFAEVIESRVPQLEDGARVYGYLPPSSELLVTPARADRLGFQDAAPHRAKLPGTYNSYVRSDGDPMYDAGREDEQMLLRPLFFTAFLLDDLLADAGFFDAATVVVSSASSKTASALAFLLAQREQAAIVGLSSQRGREFARSLGVYGEVLPYDGLEDLPGGRAVYVDIAGDAAVREAVHRHYGADLTHSAVVGATHHDRMGAVPDSLPGPRPTFFFAPERLAKRSADWGREGLERRLAGAWGDYARWTEGWLRVTRASGKDALERVYLDLLDGRIDPAEGHVLALPRD